MTDQLTAEQASVLEKVKKLMALANNNDNEHQAEAATAKAMELLAAYNLDVAMIGKSATGKQGAPRKDNKEKGGLYSWQRDLWKAVSELNFCMYWSIKGLHKGSTYEHRVLGSEVNVLASRLMAEYLQGTVERLTRDYAKTAYPGQSIFIKPLIAYREGMAYGLVQRLNALRKERLADDERKKREAAAAANHPGAASTGTGLVLMDAIENEADLNEDYLNGLEPGTTAQRRRDEKARQAAAMAAYEEQIRQRDEREAADPSLKVARLEREAQSNKGWEERMAKYAKADEQRERRRQKSGYYEREPRYRKPTPQEERMNMSEFWDGKTKSSEVGLDQQVGQQRRPGLGR